MQSLNPERHSHTASALRNSLPREPDGEVQFASAMGNDEVLRPLARLIASEIRRQRRLARTGRAANVTTV